MKSILGKYYSRIRGSQEDIVSEGLASILNSSLEAKQAFNHLLMSNGLNAEVERFSSQSTGEFNERPDISLKTHRGVEIGLIEAKFWAGLTENQPLTYLQRLSDKGLLLFICPENRKRSLTHSLIRKVEDSASIESVVEEEGVFLIKWKDKFIKLSVITWNKVFASLQKVINSSSEPMIYANFLQIQDLCKVIDTDSFQPIEEKDLSPDIPRKLVSYVGLVDDVVNELVHQKLANTEGLRSTPQKFGYVRYMAIGKIGVGLILDYRLWAEEEDTPFWLSVSEWQGDDKWEKGSEKVQLVANEFSSKKIEGKQRVVFPLMLNPGQTKDEVVDNMVSDIKKIVKKVKGVLNK